MSDAGCEVIAVYNARILLGDKGVSLANTIEQFVNSGALIAQPFLRGEFGGNPHSIGRVLTAEGLKYSTIDGFDDISAPGVYIVSFWNDSSFDSQIHTVAVEVTDAGKKVYNHKNGDNNVWSYENYSEHIFITGYKVSRK